MVSRDSCPPLGVTTPTYVGSASSQTAPAIVWRIKLIPQPVTPATQVDGAQGGNNGGLTSDTPVFIEFTLASRTANGGDVFLRTASWDYRYNFGVLPSGAQRTDWGALKLDLKDTAVPWTVKSFSTSGSDAQDFSLQIDGPNTVLAGGVQTSTSHSTPLPMESKLPRAMSR